MVSVLLVLAVLGGASGPVASPPPLYPSLEGGRIDLEGGKQTGYSWGEILIDAHRDLGTVPVTDVSIIPVELRRGETNLGLRVVSGLREGRGMVRFLNPRGTPLCTRELNPTPETTGAVIGAVYEPGMYTLEVSLSAAAGRWSVALVAMPDAAGFRALLASGPLMILLGAAFLVAWRLHGRVAWRWFAAGGLLWLAGAGLKAAWGAAFNAPILRLMNITLGHGLYGLAGCLYAGLLTAVFEVGLMIAAGLVWRRMAGNAQRAVAVGIGAGGAEATAVGLVAIIAAVAVLLSESDTTQVGAAYSMAATPLFWLVGPCQRAISLMCQMASRTLVLAGVARRRKALFLYGMLVLSGVDAVGALSGFSEQAGGISLWWVQLATAPFAVAGFYITRWCVGHWPFEENPDA